MTFDPTKDEHTQAVIKAIIEARRNKNPGSTSLRDLDREVGGLEAEHAKSSKSSHGAGVLEAEENQKVSKDGVGENSRDDKEKAKDAWDDQSEKVDKALTSRTFTKEKGQAGSALVGIEVKKLRDRREEKKEGKGDKKRPKDSHGKAAVGPVSGSILTTRLDRENGGLGGGMDSGLSGGMSGRFGGTNRGGQSGGRTL